MPSPSGAGHPTAARSAPSGQGARDAGAGRLCARVLSKKRSTRDELKSTRYKSVVVSRGERSSGYVLLYYIVFYPLIVSKGSHDTLDQASDLAAWLRRLSNWIVTSNLSRNYLQK